MSPEQLRDLVVFLEALAAFGTVVAWYGAMLGFLSLINPNENLDDLSHAVDSGAALAFVPGALTGVFVYAAKAIEPLGQQSVFLPS